MFMQDFVQDFEWYFNIENGFKILSGFGNFEEMCATKIQHSMYRWYAMLHGGLPPPGAPFTDVDQLKSQHG